MALADHPLRTALTNELHARPSPPIALPAQIACLVLKAPENAAQRDPGDDHDALDRLITQYGAPKCDRKANHCRVPVGQAELKWERHTEIATYTVLRSDAAQRPFDDQVFEVFPPSWAGAQAQAVLSSVLIDLRHWTSEAEIEAFLLENFNTESLVASYVLDQAALVAGDFRMDSAGHLRFAVFVKPGIGPNRVGRIAQRICEIETYKSLSMLGFAKARAVGKQVAGLDDRLTGLLAGIERQNADETLSQILDISGEIERLSSVVSFRFSATEAYEMIVHQRIDALRESRFRGRQTLGDFMARRYDPAMRTVQSTKGKLDRMSGRAANAAQLLRTRVDVDRAEQSQQLLISMDRRADAQLQLQKTVEGLSVVAIGYYAVSLAGYAVAPLAKAMGWDKSVVLGVLSVPIVLAVWWVVRSIRARH